MGTRTHKMSTPWSPFHIGQLLWMEPSLGVWLIDPVTLLWRKLLFCFPETINQLQMGPCLEVGLCILSSVLGLCLVNSVESCGYCCSLLNCVCTKLFSSLGSFSRIFLPLLPYRSLSLKGRALTKPSHLGLSVLTVCTLSSCVSIY